MKKDERRMAFLRRLDELGFLGVYGGALDGMSAIALTRDQQTELRGGFLTVGKEEPDDLDKAIVDWLIDGREADRERVKKVWSHCVSLQLADLATRTPMAGPEPRSRTAKGYVYLIRSLDMYKIGKASDLEARMKTYRTENPHGLEMVAASGQVIDPSALERSLLERFAGKSVVGEWHRLEADDVEWIKGEFGKTKK